MYDTFNYMTYNEAAPWVDLTRYFAVAMHAMQPASKLNHSMCNADVNHYFT